MRQYDDRRIAGALKRGTDGAVTQRDRVWRGVSGGMAAIKKEREMKMTRRRRSLWLTTAAAATVAAAALVFFSTTPEGTALADRIVKFFAPEKTVETQIEGSTETQSATLNTNTSEEVGYVIYIDAERYRKESSGGVDYYKALNAPEGYPPVQMEISQLKDRGAQEEYQAVLKDVGSQYDVAEGQGQVDDPVKGWAIMAYDDDGSDAPYEDIYVVDNTQGGCFLIRCKMFREATEGHGARFHAMLKTFAVMKSSQIETGKPDASPVPTATLAGTKEPTATPRAAAHKLTWDDLALFGVKLSTEGREAIEKIQNKIGSAPSSDETADDIGGTTRTVKWSDHTVAVVRNGKLYSIETTTESVPLPFGICAGMPLTEFVATLGEPHEAIDGALAWGVGSNDNLIVTVQDGVVRSVKVSLTE